VPTGDGAFPTSSPPQSIVQAKGMLLSGGLVPTGDRALDAGDAG